MRAQIFDHALHCPLSVRRRWIVETGAKGIKGIDPEVLVVQKVDILLGIDEGTRQVPAIASSRHLDDFLPVVGCMKQFVQFAVKTVCLASGLLGDAKIMRGHMPVVLEPVILIMVWNIWMNLPLRKGELASLGAVPALDHWAKHHLYSLGMPGVLSPLTRLGILGGFAGGAALAADAASLTPVYKTCAANAALSVEACILCFPKALAIAWFFLLNSYLPTFICNYLQVLIKK